MIRFADSHEMLYHVKSEQVSLAKRATRTGFVFTLTLLGALFIHRLWFAQHPLAFGEKLFDAVVAAGAFLVFDSQRREYEVEVSDETISMRGAALRTWSHSQIFLWLRLDSRNNAAVRRDQKQGYELDGDRLNAGFLTPS